MKRGSRQIGFTLVELLVVIGIIAALIAILLPALHKARQQAQLIQCQSSLRQWGIGIMCYLDENKGALPIKGPGGNITDPFTPQNTNNVISGYNDPLNWFNAIPPYITNKKSYYDLLVLDSQHTASSPAPHYGNYDIFVCPAALSPAGVPGYDTVDPNNPDYFDLYGIDSTNAIRSGLHSAGYFRFDICYVWNSKMLSPIVAPSNWNSDTMTIKISVLRQSSLVPLMVEKISNRGEYQDSTVQSWCAANPSVYSNVGGAQHQGEITSVGFSGSNLQQAKSDWTRFAVCHNHGGNILFADGHVGWYRWADVQYSPQEFAATGGHWSSTSDANVNPGGILWCPIGPTD